MALHIFAIIYHHGSAQCSLFCFKHLPCNKTAMNIDHFTHYKKLVIVA